MQFAKSHLAWKDEYIVDKIDKGDVFFVKTKYLGFWSFCFL